MNPKHMAIYIVCVVAAVGLWYEIALPFYLSNIRSAAGFMYPPLSEIELAYFVTAGCLIAGVRWWLKNKRE